MKKLATITVEVEQGAELPNIEHWVYAALVSFADRSGQFIRVGKNGKTIALDLLDESERG